MKTALFLAAALALGACAGRAPEPVTEATASALCAASGAPTPECISAQMAAGGSDADARDTLRHVLRCRARGFAPATGGLLLCADQSQTAERRQQAREANFQAAVASLQMQSWGNNLGNILAQRYAPLPAPVWQPAPSFTCQDFGIPGHPMVRCR